MSTTRRQFSALESARLHDEARRTAQALRREAVNTMWSDLDTALNAALDHAGRAARRLAQRLQHHRAGRLGL